MATAEQIAEVRALLPDSSNQALYGVTWGDEQISVFFDLKGTVSKTVLAYWNAALANTAMYVDVNESGSSRSLSTVWRNVWEMVQRWDKIVADEDAKNERDVIGNITFGTLKRA